MQFNLTTGIRFNFFHLFVARLGVFTFYESEAFRSNLQDGHVLFLISHLLMQLLQNTWWHGSNLTGFFKNSRHTEHVTLSDNSSILISRLGNESSTPPKLVLFFFGLLLSAFMLDSNAFRASSSSAFASSRLFWLLVTAGMVLLLFDNLTSFLNSCLSLSKLISETETRPVFFHFSQLSPF